MLFNYSSKRGLSLIELLIVLGIGVILATIVFGSFANFRTSQLLNEGSEVLQSTLDKARSQTLASTNDYQYGVHIASGQLVIFRGSGYSSGASTNEVITVNPSIGYTPSLSGGGSDIIFQRLTGKTSQSGTILITVGSQTRTIIVSQTGGAGVN